MSASEAELLLAGLNQRVRHLTVRIQDLVASLLPDAQEEVDTTARLLAFTYHPGTSDGLIVAVVPHTTHVNLLFARGAELTEVDRHGLLEGTGKRARHIRFHDETELDRPGIAALVEEAARRTPRR
ncbi:DUF1801 domain-containing protein [Ornithinicoccus halotolerans]|uniref:DUF1801 domain-containing protein n=1 Tax=Ornithinicoccus halotolerans TaxID=1748220 RepID=UPI0012973D0B|nr:DUF1801 domain-containing protein [Ornithinicoccus halotolerans]